MRASTRLKSAFESKESHAGERLKRLEELASTEKQYVEELRSICERPDVSSFGNVKELWEIHKALEKRLAAADKRMREAIRSGRDARLAATEAEAEFAKVLEEMAPFLRAYTMYCQSYREDEVWIKPVQRLCKYPLFFQAMKRHASGDTKRRLDRALESVSSAVDGVNAGIADLSSMAKVVQLYTDAFDADPNVGTLVTPSRRFVASGHVVVEFEGLKLPGLHYFLFNDLLLLAAPKPAHDNKFVLLHRFSLVDLDLRDAISLSHENRIFMRYQNRTGASYSTTTKTKAKPPKASGQHIKLQDLDKAALTLDSDSSDGLRSALRSTIDAHKTLHVRMEANRGSRKM